MLWAGSVFFSSLTACHCWRREELGAAALTLCDGDSSWNTPVQGQQGSGTGTTRILKGEFHGFTAVLSTPFL